MLWRLLWSLRARPPAGGAGAAAPGLCRCPVWAHDKEPPPPPFPCPESAQAGSSRHGRQQQHKGFRCGNLLQHSAPLDAITWGVLAAFALELAKQIKWLSSVQLRGDRPGLLHLEGHLAVLPPHQYSVPSTAPAACSSGEKEPHSFVGEHSSPTPENTHPSKTSQPEASQLLSETEEDVLQPSTDPEPASHLLLSQDKLEPEESLREAASQVQRAFQTSVSVAFNILGLELMQDGQQRLAFSCFKLAADQKYSKAQFNVGLCYELGRGTKKNVAQAALYYQQAAHQGHPVGQYRYAKWLLRHWPKPTSDSSVQEAVSLLDQAATAGLTQAQAYLGVLYLKGLEPGKEKVQKYLRMAAKSGDSLSRFHLGVCYEKGFGVPQNRRSARKHYQQAAEEGSKPAQERMEMMTEQDVAAMQSRHPSPLAARTCSSSPCLQSLEQPPPSRLGQPALSLLHSWSTGDLSDVTNTYMNCLPIPAYPGGISFKLQPFAMTSRVAVG